MADWSGKHAKNKRDITPAAATEKKKGVLLSHPDFVIIGSAYGKGGMANPQPFIDITAHFMRQANLHYWQIDSQSMRTVDGMGRPQEEVEVKAEEALESLPHSMKLKLPDMLFCVLTRGYTPENELRYVCLSLLGDRLESLLQKIARGETLDTVACETEILYQGDNVPEGTEQTRLRRDYRFNTEQVQLELGKAGA